MSSNSRPPSIPVMSTFIVQTNGGGLELAVEAENALEAVQKLADKWFPLKETHTLSVRMVIDTDKAET
jgi:hypothetical protein